MRHWLMKSEPDVFSIENLAKAKTSWWDGVRNYQARNFMMNDMKPGDLVLFYHSNAEPPGIAGIAKVVSSAQPDVSQFDRKSEYFDPKATREKPRWFCVKVGFVHHFKHFISLEELRSTVALKDMLVLKKGQRLSIQPVELKDYSFIEKMGRA